MPSINVTETQKLLFKTHLHKISKVKGRIVAQRELFEIMMILLNQALASGMIMEDVWDVIIDE